MKEYENIAIMDNLRHLLAMAAEDMMASDTDMTVRQKLFVVLEELYNNVALHAYEGREPGLVRIRLLSDPDAVQLRIEDQGAPFNLLEYDDSKRFENVLSLTEGGEGIFLVKVLSNQVTYDRIGEWNRVDVFIER